MKVYVMTKYKPFGVEQYVGVKKTEKEAVEAFREMFPHMRGTVKDNNMSSDAHNTYVLSIKEVNLD